MPLASSAPRAAIERIRRLHVMKETGNPAESLQCVLAELREDLHEGRLGVVFEAYRDAHVKGVPERLSEDLMAIADKAALHYSRGQKEAFDTTRRELRQKMTEAEKSLSRWRDRGNALILLLMVLASFWFRPGWVVRRA